MTEDDIPPKDDHFTYESLDPWSGYRTVAKDESEAKVYLFRYADDVLSGKFTRYIYLSSTSFNKWMESGMPVRARPELDYRAPKTTELEKMFDPANKLQVYA